MQAIILAGGRGTRLRPFTTTIPKPLIPLGETPIIEIIIGQLRRDGFKNIVVAVNHLKELIQAFLGDGKRWNVKINYSIEDKFLGTAGPIRAVKNLEDDFLVINGDTLTTYNFEKFLRFHKKSGAAATIATFKREVKIDFGVVQKEKSGRLTDFIEKPSYFFEVSVGINAFNKRVLKYIKKGERLDLPQLIARLMRANEKVAACPLEGMWLDIGHLADYETANAIFEKSHKRFFKGRK